MLPTIAEFPFTAVTGQQQFKTALLLVAVNPAIGGVLISGPRGSAKSTLARALADILKGVGSFDAQPFVTLPLGATEEMLLGTLDLQQVLNKQQVDFSPGLLAKAHRGILYVDEVNLLADTLVDLLLDVAASGVNHIERDGISHVHESRFVLVGTMNADEGELRPQLQDRFGLTVELSNHYSLAERIEIVQRRETFDRDPALFVQHYASEQQALVDTIGNARKLLTTVSCNNTLRQTIAQRCVNANVDGLRADIVWYRAALAHAALCGREQVLVSDLDAVEALVLNHRRQQDETPPPAPGSKNTPSSNTHTDCAKSLSTQTMGEWGDMPAQAFDVGKTVLFTNNPSTATNNYSKQILSASVFTKKRTKQQGKFLNGSRRSLRMSNSVNWFTTLITNIDTWPPRTLCFQKAKTSSQVLHLVLLDTSSSTFGNRLISHAKSIVLSIAEQAYFAREQLQIVSFRGQKTDDVLCKIRAPKMLRQTLKHISAGGGTPLRVALLHAQQILTDLTHRMPALALRTYVITDGRSTQNINDISLPGKSFLIDTEQSSVKRGRGPAIARILGAAYIPMPVGI